MQISCKVFQVQGRGRKWERGALRRKYSKLIWVEKAAYGIPEYCVAPTRGWWLLALCFFKAELPFCLCGYIWHDTISKYLFQTFKHSTLMSDSKNIFIHKMSLVIHIVCVQNRGHIWKLTSSGEAYLVSLTNPETKVTTQDGLNIKIPN